MLLHASFLSRQGDDIMWTVKEALKVAQQATGYETLKETSTTSYGSLSMQEGCFCFHAYGSGQKPHV